MMGPGKSRYSHETLTRDIDDHGANEGHIRRFASFTAGTDRDGSECLEC
jgi:hypothetical protein